MLNCIDDSLQNQVFVFAIISLSEMQVTSVAHTRASANLLSRKFRSLTGGFKRKAYDSVCVVPCLLLRISWSKESLLGTDRLYLNHTILHRNMTLLWDFSFRKKGTKFTHNGKIRSLRKD